MRLDLRFLDKAATPGHLETTAQVKHDPWKLCTVTQVEEVKMLARVFPIWLTNIMFWVVYAQVTTLFLNQATTLDRHVGPHFQIPAASMPLFLHLSICLFLPVYDHLVVPLARKLTRNPRGFTSLQRIAIGQAFSILPITAAALVEVRRLRLAHEESNSNALPLPMSIFWLAPQYALMGVTEVFLSVGQIEFFTDQAPESMRSLGNAMACCVISLGSFGSSVLVGVVTTVTESEDAPGGWIGNGLINGGSSHVDYFYWLLSVLTVVNLGVYLWCARRFRKHEDGRGVECGKAMGGGGGGGCGGGGGDAARASVDSKRVHPVLVDGHL